MNNMNNFEDDAYIYLVRDTVTGGYLSSSKYWMIGLRYLSPKSKAHVYTVERSANALRNKVGREFKSDYENVDNRIKDGCNPDNDMREIIDDWGRRHNLKNFGFETVKIKI